MSNKTGNFLLKGTTSYFPEKPYTIDGSVKENIIFYEEFHSLKYYNAISLAQLNNDILCSYPGYDDVPIDYLELNIQQLQKISLARAIFCDRYIVAAERTEFVIFFYIALPNFFVQRYCSSGGASKCFRQ